MREVSQIVPARVTLSMCARITSFVFRALTANAENRAAPLGTTANCVAGNGSSPKPKALVVAPEIGRFVPAANVSVTRGLKTV
jgi:hypothetical protein